MDESNAVLDRFWEEVKVVSERGESVFVRNVKGCCCVSRFDDSDGKEQWTSRCGTLQAGDSVD